MLGTPIASSSAFTYDQQDIPSGSIATGATWRQRNSSNVPVRQFVFDGNCWRLAGGLLGSVRSLDTVASSATVTGSATTAITNTLVRRIQVTAGNTGTGKSTFNSSGGGIQSPLGQAGTTTSNTFFDFSKAIEVLTRIRLNKTGTLRFYLTSNTGLAANADLNMSGFGALVDLVTGGVTLHLHDGTSLFTQSGGTLSWWAGNAAPTLDLELVWDGVSRLGLYVNGAYVTAINQAITGTPPLFFHLGFDQSAVSAVTQQVDHHFIQTIGGY